MLVFLADQANPALMAWPSLAILFGFSDRTVRNALREFEALGEIRTVTHRQGQGATRYRIELLANGQSTAELFA